MANKLYFEIRNEVSYNKSSFMNKKTTEFVIQILYQILILIINVNLFYRRMNISRQELFVASGEINYFIEQS